MNLRLVWTLCGGDARENYVIFALNGSVFEMYLDHIVCFRQAIQRSQKCAIKFSLEHFVKT